MEETREERIAKLVKEVQELLEREFPEKGSTMQHIEELTEKIGREIEGRIEEEATEQESRGYEGSYVVCKCGWTARYVRDYEKRVVTLHGERTVTRAYYYCSGCKKGFCPIDETLELDGGCTTMAVRAKIARLAALVPFPDAPGQVGRCALALGPSGVELSYLCEIEVSAKTVERVAELVGSQIGREMAEGEAYVLSGHAKEPELAPERLYVLAPERRGR